MTRSEFAAILAYLQTGTGMRTPPTAEQAEVYFDLLGDLDAATVQAAAKIVLLNHAYPSLPPAGAIRRAAVTLGQPEITPGEAWTMFLAAVRKYGTGRREILAGGCWQVLDAEQTGLESLPDCVGRAARAFGWAALANTTAEGIPYAQERFLRIYGQVHDREVSEAIQLPAVREHIASLAAAMDGRLPPAAPRALAAGQGGGGHARR